MLETLAGYNIRRASLVAGALFEQRMSRFELRQTGFSVLALLAHNPGATSRQLCAALDIQPPNLVSLIAVLDRRGLVERRPHPYDGRALGLHLTAAGIRLAEEAEQAIRQLEIDVYSRLTERERATLIRLLEKIYQDPSH
jgi:DNA-binding MarR family transcriptional regulator